MATCCSSAASADAHGLPRVKAARRVDVASKAVHDECSMKNAALTIRLPASLKRRLQARAESQHRSLSAQVVADLERVADEVETSASHADGRFLGRFAGTAMPTDDDLAEVRSLLCRRIGHHERRP